MRKLKLTEVKNISIKNDKNSSAISAICFMYKMLLFRVCGRNHAQLLLSYVALAGGYLWKIRIHTHSRSGFQDI